MGGGIAPQSAPGGVSSDPDKTVALVLADHLLRDHAQCGLLEPVPFPLGEEAARVMVAGADADG